MPALANVAITDTFDTWRIRTNQIIIKGNDDETITLAAFNKANTFNNVYTTIAGANAFASATIAGANTAVGAGANAFTSATIAGANTYLITTIAGANAAVGIGANTYTIAATTGANTYLLNTISGANTISTAAFNKANSALPNTSGATFAGALSINGGIIGRAIGGGEGGEINLNNPDNLSVGLIIDVGTANNGRIYQDKNNSTLQLGQLVGTGGSVILSTSSAERIRIDSSGNVGIGTSSPAATLDVSGSVSVAKANVLSQILTDAATINWDASSGQVATVTLAGNRTIAAPTNLRVGTYILHVVQDGTGSRTISWNSVFKWPAGVAPTLTTTANRRDLFSFVCDGTNLYGSFLPDVR